MGRREKGINKLKTVGYTKIMMTKRMNRKKNLRNFSFIQISNVKFHYKEFWKIEFSIFIFKSFAQRLCTLNLEVPVIHFVFECQ